MPIYDHAVNPRMGQRTDSDNTVVLMFSGENIPEAPWHGMLIYRTDEQILQVYRSSVFGGDDAFEEIIGGVAGQLTFVGDNPPTAVNAGDLWFDTNDNRKLYRAASAGANEIAVGEWEIMSAAPTAADLSGPLPEALEIADLTDTVVTGLTLQTASAGARTEMATDSGGAIAFYTGNNDDEPGAVTPRTGGGASGLDIKAGRTAAQILAGADVPKIEMDTDLDGDGHSRIRFTSSKVRIITDNDDGAGMFVTGNINVTGQVTTDNDYSIRSRTSSQTILNDTWTKLVLGTDVSSVSSDSVIWNGGTDTWELAPGRYEIFAYVQYDTDAQGDVGERGLRIKNGSNVMVRDYSVACDRWSVTTSQLFATLTDGSITVETYQNSGGDLDINSEVRVSIYRLG